MTNAVLQVRRLLRSELQSKQYKKFLAALFAVDNIEQRLRYAQWAFGDNPASSSATELPIYICLENDQLAGQLAVIPLTTLNNGAEIATGWCVDFFVSSDHQRKGIGSLLIDAARKDFDVLMTLGQTELSYKLFVKLGWHYDGNRLTQYTSFLKFRHLLLYFLKKSGFMKMPLKRVVDIDKAGSHFSSQTGAVKPPHSGIIKSASYLNWRFKEHPFFNYHSEIITLENNRCITYIWRYLDDDTFCRVSIVDVLYDNTLSSADFKLCWRKLQHALSKRGVEVLECQTNDQQIISAWPFLSLASKTVRARFLFSRDKLDSKNAKHVNGWTLYSSDCDVDSTFLPT